MTINNEQERILSYEETMYFLLKDVAASQDIYITNYHTVPILNFYFGYSKNYSGPHGYTGPTNTSFYDLHFVQNWSTIYDAYIIFEPAYFSEDLDEYSYYKYHNVSYAHLNEGTFVIPPHWTNIFVPSVSHQPFYIFYAQPQTEQ